VIGYCSSYKKHNLRFRDAAKEIEKFSGLHARNHKGMNLCGGAEKQNTLPQKEKGYLVYRGRP